MCIGRGASYVVSVESVCVVVRIGVDRPWSHNKSVDVYKPGLGCACGAGGVCVLSSKAGLPYVRSRFWYCCSRRVYLEGEAWDFSLGYDLAGFVADHCGYSSR